MRVVKAFVVLATGRDGSGYELRVMATCFEMAEVEARRNLPEGASVTYIETEA